MLKPYDFFFEVPLYTRIEIADNNKEEFISLMAKTNSVDGYNIELKENTTYTVFVNRHITHSRYELSTYEGITEITLTCVRTQNAIAYFVLLISYEEGDGTEKHLFLKIGQFPSIADLHISKFKQYDKVIDKNHLKEITRAIGLAANGVGIGSFVYLRRVFEFLLEEAHLIAMKDNGWNDELYQKVKVVDRIEQLKHHLPEFLVKNKSMYSILSVGIHKLEEQECLKYFEALKVGIELILDEKVELYNKQKKIEEAEKKIQLITQQVKK